MAFTLDKIMENPNWRQPVNARFFREIPAPLQGHVFDFYNLLHQRFYDEEMNRYRILILGTIMKMTVNPESQSDKDPEPTLETIN